MSDRPAISCLDMQVISNQRVAPSIYIMRLASPELSASTLPGQFVHLEIPDLEAHILRRPFSVYDSDQSDGTVDILYQVLGSGTEAMSQWVEGLIASAIGPIGRPWSPDQGTRHALLVGGGVGAAPLNLLAKQLIAQGAAVDIVIGAQTSEMLACKPGYEALAHQHEGQACLHCSTDDGSFGIPGFCTDVASELIASAKNAGEPYDYIAACGPEPVMMLVSKAAIEAGIEGEVSMERRMACGIGACLSCIVETVHGRKRACVDGPTFKMGEVIW